MTTKLKKTGATLLSPSLSTVLAAVVLATFAPQAASTASAQSAGVEAQVAATSAAWDAAFNAGDLEGLMELYADDVISMPFNLPTRVGKAAVRADLAWLFANYTDLYHQTTLVGLIVRGGIAIERGEYVLYGRPLTAVPPINEVGKHVVVYVKVGNKWLDIWEIWNTDF